MDSGGVPGFDTGARWNFAARFPVSLRSQLELIGMPQAT